MKKRAPVHIFLLLFLATLCSYTGEKPPVAMEFGLVPDAKGAGYWAIVHFIIQENWHIYWINPGESGYPVNIALTLPPGWHQRPPLWPAPKSFRSADALSYGYEREVSLLIELTPPEGGGLDKNPWRIEGTVDWLMCNELCIPDDQAIDWSSQQLGDPGLEKKWASRLWTSQSRLPIEEHTLSPRVEAIEGHLRLSFNPAETESLTELAFYPANDGLIIDPTPTRIEFEKNRVHANFRIIGVKRPKFGERLHGVLSYCSQGIMRTFSVKALIEQQRRL